ncbi:sensor histidine kinase [Aquabacterium sp.]|uniref:sensor histidine kinase n=1 Tax=Aquabacterium sp. TaxID=1872578 RepID=UPI002C4BAACF|nr:sensor histidine kinase N-terminal domain-containing protein [Aquabacterium sp.]HSW09245.1 sensor histidine kinase N-terminal domain-containing protein [Aquabacterium sp.]
MKLDALHRLSLRRTLLATLLPGMLLVAAAEIWLTWRTAADAANAAYDRSLLGAIKSIDANISTDSGGLAVELPYRLLEFFELTANGQVYYRVATEDGLVEIGSADLPAPQRALISAQPQFSDAVYFGVPVRVGSYARVLGRPIGGAAAGQRVVIQVAEDLGSREAFTRRLIVQAVQRDGALIAFAAALLAGAVGWALRPLAGLRDEVSQRAPEDLSPVATTRVPADVRPLVDAINHHIARNRDLTEAQRRFVDDASHQLRTPLTTLATQVGFALREPDPQRMHDALLAIKAQLDETVRQTNQMLTLARADTAALSREPVDVVALAEAVTRACWPAARGRDIDLGFEPGEPALTLSVHAALLQEALSNLIHNAIRYTPGGSKVTVRVGRAAGQAVIEVLDNGPGLAAEALQRAGERFFRGAGVALPGSGLGLAIARSIARRHGGELQVVNGAEGTGLVATLELPLAP